MIKLSMDHLHYSSETAFLTIMYDEVFAFFNQVLYQEPNPGIVYRYIIPGNANVPVNPHYGHKTGTSYKLILI